MPQVQVGFSTVIGDKYLAVLQRAHGTRIHVDVGVELGNRDTDPTADEQTTQGCRCNTFPQARDNATGNKNEPSQQGLPPKKDKDPTAMT